MRILQVGSGMVLWGGSERYLMDVTLGLLKRGHEVTVACAPGSMLDGWTRENHIPHVSLEMRHFYQAQQTPRFVRAYKAGRFDVVHIHGAPDYFVPAFAARLASIPAIVMTRHLPHPFRAKWRAYLCSELLYHKIIAVSEYVASVLRNSGVEQDRIAVVPNGVIPPPPTSPDEGSRLREELGIPAGALLAAAAGRITAGKGFNVLVEAVAILHRQGFPVYAAIFGHGDEREQLQELVTRLGLEEFVRLPGYRQDVYRLWCAADAAVVPSDGPESFGYTAIEALASGRPLVASRIGGLPETITEACGVLVNPGDAADLARGIRSVLSSPHRAAMGAAALERSRKFTLDRTLTGLEEVYRGLLANSGSLARA